MILSPNLFNDSLKPLGPPIILNKRFPAVLSLKRTAASQISSIVIPLSRLSFVTGA